MGNCRHCGQNAGFLFPHLRLLSSHIRTKLIVTDLPANLFYGSTWDSCKRKGWKITSRPQGALTALSLAD